MSEWRGIDPKRPTTWAILAFVLVLIWAFAREATAETIVRVTPETMFVAGNKYDGSALSIVERFSDKYDIGIGLYTELQCRRDCKRGDGRTNMRLHVKRVVQPNRWLELGVGASYWKNQNPAWDSHITYALHIGWNTPTAWSPWFPDQVVWQHASTGGSSESNGGLDYLSFGWKF